MKPRYFALLALVLGPVASPQGRTMETGTQGRCSADERMDEVYVRDPAVYEERNRLEVFTRTFRDPGLLRKAGAQTYVIPVVFHVHDASNPERVTAAQVASAMQILNEDFNAQNADFTAISTLFRPLAANLSIRFALAGKDPEGRPTTGIHYYRTSYCGRNDQLKTTSSWPPSRYLNIWVVGDVECNGATNNSGWAYLPSTSLADRKVDGIVYNYRYLGRLGSSLAVPGNANYHMARTLTHEVGHYLNLNHTFIGTCSNARNDAVDDTPPVRFTSGTGRCPASPTSVSDAQLSCDMKTVVNYENFMDYSNCTRMFTEGQKTRMLAALNSAVGYRNSLWSPANLAATGVDLATGIAARPARRTNSMVFGEVGGFPMWAVGSWGTGVEVMDVRGRVLARARKRSP